MNPYVRAAQRKGFRVKAGSGEDDGRSRARQLINNAVNYNDISVLQAGVRKEYQQRNTLLDKADEIVNGIFDLDNIIDQLGGCAGFFYSLTDRDNAVLQELSIDDSSFNSMRETWSSLTFLVARLRAIRGSVNGWSTDYLNAKR